MGRFDDAAADAAKETDAELEAELQQLKEIPDSKVPELFPLPADQEAARTLIAAVNKATDKNELMTAFKAFAVVASVEAVDKIGATFKVAKKVFL